MSTQTRRSIPSGQGSSKATIKYDVCGAPTACLELVTNFTCVNSFSLPLTTNALPLGFLKGMRAVMNLQPIARVQVPWATELPNLAAWVAFEEDVFISSQLEEKQVLHGCDTDLGSHLQPGIKLAGVCSNLASKATKACGTRDLLFLEAEFWESTLVLLGKASLLGQYFTKLRALGS